MPLREYTCLECEADTTELFMGDYPKEIDCPECAGEGYQARAVYKLSLPAKTAMKWGDCWGKHGVNGIYDRGLGARYSNSAERDRICKERGLVPLSEIGEAHVEKVVNKTRKEIARAESDTQRYEAALVKHDGNKEAAVVEAFPAKMMLERQAEHVKEST